MNQSATWFPKRGSPMFLLLGLLGITVTTYTGYSKLWLPFARRRKLNEAEKYADFIYEQSKKL